MVKMMSNLCGKSVKMCEIAEKRRITTIVELLSKDCQNYEEKKISMKTAIKEKKAGIFHQIPRTVEYAYSRKVKKIAPLLEGNPVSYKNLLDELLVPEVHVGEEIQECPNTCPQKKSCVRIREVYRLIQIIVKKLSECDDVFHDLGITLIGSLREGTRIFKSDEIDIHLSLNEEKFRDRAEYDAVNQKLFLDGKEFECNKFFELFLTSVHGIVENIKLPDNFTMKSLKTNYEPCLLCMKIEDGEAQAYRCRHVPDCAVHKECRCDKDCSCKCECKEYTSPSLTRSKIGAALHFGKFSFTS